MPETTEAAHTDEATNGDQRSVGKLQRFEILNTLTQSFEQILGQLRQLEKLGLGHQPWKPSA
jgi:hypothetical protein